MTFISSRMRKNIVLTLASISYLVCSITLFLNSSFFVPLISFVFLFLCLYFLAFDLIKIKKKWICLVILGAMMGEMLFLGSGDRHFYLGMFFFHGMIVFMLLSQIWMLKNTVKFRTFGYFTGGSTLIAVLLTLFFSVIMLGKYSQLPFSCNDINDFPMNIF